MSQQWEVPHPLLLLQSLPVSPHSAGEVVNVCDVLMRQHLVSKATPNSGAPEIGKRRHEGALSQ